MQISSRFTIAVHMLVCMATFQGDRKVTGDFLASSVNVNPVIVRRLLQQLKAARLVTVTRGSGGAELSAPAGEITLLDVCRAVESVEAEGLFHFHENPNPLCPVGRNIHRLLDDRLDAAQRAMERELAAVTLADLLHDVRTLS